MQAKHLPSAPLRRIVQRGQAPAPYGATNRMNRQHQTPSRVRAGSPPGDPARHAITLLRPIWSLNQRGRRASGQRALRIMPQRSAAGPMFNQAPDRLLLRDTPDAMESVKIATHTWPQTPFTPVPTGLTSRILRSPAPTTFQGTRQLLRTGSLQFPAAMPAIRTKARASGSHTRPETNDLEPSDQ